MLVIAAELLTIPVLLLRLNTPAENVSWLATEPVLLDAPPPHRLQCPRVVSMPPCTGFSCDVLPCACGSSSKQRYHGRGDGNVIFDDHAPIAMQFRLSRTPET
jgi:hypothetical protein